MMVDAFELASATWSHRIKDAVACTTVQLRSGQTIRTNEVGAVLNRVRSLPPMGFARSSERERAYAETELQALFVSFLQGFAGKVTNGVDGHGPLGLWSSTRWAMLAHRCGIRTLESCVTTGARRLTNLASRSTSTVVVVGARAFGAASPEERDRCVELGRLAGCDTIGIDFDASSERELIAVDPFPPLRGEVADAVAMLLCDRASATTALVAS